MARHGIIVTILGKQWEIVFRKKLDENNCGECDSPDTPRKKIRMRKESEIDTTIHELMHADGWHIDEVFVTQFATDAAAILIRAAFA